MAVARTSITCSLYPDLAASEAVLVDVTACC